MGLMAAGAAALITAANIETSPEEGKTDNGNVFTNIFSGLLKQNNNQSNEIDKYKEENEKLKKENEELKTKLADKTESTEQTKNNTEIECVPDNKFMFPKKRGRLSGNQQELKSVTETLDLSPTAKEKLLLICQELLIKNSHIVDGKEKDNDEINKDFANELSNSKNNQEQTENIINKYYILCNLESEPEKSAEDLNKVGKNNNVKYGAPKIAGPKVVGKIVLPQKPSELIIRDKDGNIESLFYRKTGTPSEYYAEQLDEMLRFFIKTIYNDYKERAKQNPELVKPKWLFNIPLPKSIRKQDVAAEVKKQAKRNEGYKYIKEEHFKEIVTVINEDPRYNDLFDIHSALRLTDRFVNVNSDSEGIDIQSKRVLNKLFEMIEQAYKNGTYINAYTDKETGLIGASITLKAENFDSEAVKIFGPTDIVIGISERQNGKMYRGVDNSRKEAIISTIYPNCM